MITLQGVGASPGIAIGPARIMDVRLVIEEGHIDGANQASEVRRLGDAIAIADGQLVSLLRQIEEQGGGQGYEFIEVHRSILHSPELVGEARRLILDNRFGAEWAVFQAMSRIRGIFARLEDPYFRDRGGDFEVVGERVLRVLLGLPELRSSGEPAAGGVVVGVDISPLDPSHFKRSGIVAILSENGGTTSHAAIMARSFGLPYVVGGPALVGKVKPASTLIVDGGRGLIIVDPDAACLALYKVRLEGELRRKQHLASTRDDVSITTDGIRVHLAANVEALDGLGPAFAAGAESIGLFRTEFLYLERSDLPSEEEQYNDALASIAKAKGRMVTFRTLDLGSDKVPSGMPPAPSPNPALGLRAIRYSLRHPEILKTQLRALSRAATQGPLRILFPLITGLSELRRVKIVHREVLLDLAREGIPHASTVSLGIMVETPSAAWTVDHLARHIDFLSVGTNDLIQYAFAMDRENNEVSYLYQPLHPAVLRALQSIVVAGKANGIGVSLCGDMAGDPTLTWILLGLGLRELSMDADRIPVVKAVIRKTSLAEARELATMALTLEDEEEVQTLVRARMAERFPDLFNQHSAPPTIADDLRAAPISEPA